MKDRITALLTTFFIFGIIFISFNCGGTGSSFLSSTEPGIEIGNPPGPGPSDISATVPLRDKMCEIINACIFGFPSFSMCYGGINQTTNIGAYLGLNPGVTFTYLEIIEMEENNQLEPNANAFYACFFDISNLSCEDARVKNSFNLISPNDFDSVFRMLIPQSDYLYPDGHCRDIFSGDSLSPHFQPPEKDEFLHFSLRDL